MVDSSAQRGTSFSRCYNGWKLSVVRWRAHRKYVGALVSRLLIVTRRVCFCISVLLSWPFPAASCGALQNGTHVALLMSWICTTVQQGRGQQLTSALRAIVSQPHRSGMWLCSLGVIFKVVWFNCGGVCKWPHLLQCCVTCVRCSTANFLIQSTADTYSSLNDVDIFNSATGTWSTAQLSMKRRALGATSVGKVVLFAGGGVSDGTFVQ